MRRITATLAIRRRVEGAVDRYGNPTISYGPPEPWPVYAVEPRVGEEPMERARDALISSVVVYAPSSPRPGPLDRVEHLGVTWEVRGQVGDWDRNPHVPVTTQRGIAVNLERKEG